VRCCMIVEIMLFKTLEHCMPINVHVLRQLLYCSKNDARRHPRHVSMRSESLQPSLGMEVILEKETPTTPYVLLPLKIFCGCARAQFWC
jgi:hypothetical protein